MDFRRAEYRREVFLRFYLFHLRHRSHPGAVYYLFPWLRQRFFWDDEQALWFAFLNGNTQNPLTSLLLFWQCDRPGGDLQAMFRFYRRNYARLAFDTDRRHWKKSLPEAVESYVEALRSHGGSQSLMWTRAAEDGFDGVWDTARSLYGFGRLSAFSYTEYLRIMEVPFDCDRLFLDDREGSRSHRNGLCIVSGRDDWDWHASNPGFDGRYDEAMTVQLQDEADELLAEARARTAGRPWSADAGYFTLESALCTYKSWHRPNRRYAGVYNDMLYDRIRAYEAKWPEAEPLTDLFWQARREHLPHYLRLEDNPTDPGCTAEKQNWYRTTGEVPVLGHEDPVFWSGFDEGVRQGLFGLRKDVRRKAKA